MHFMAAGETLLKISDYPFSYSIVGIALSLLGYQLSSENFLTYVAIAGFVGTFIIATEPLGRLIKFITKKLPTPKKSELIKTKQYSTVINQGIESKPITLEIEKIVHFLYFAIALGFSYIGIAFSELIAKKFIILDAENIPICDLDCLRFWGFFVIAGAMIILGIIGGIRLQQLRKRTIFAGVFQGSINSKFISTQTISSMERSLEIGDWRSVENWATRIAAEVKNELSLQKTRQNKTSEHISSLLSEFSNATENANEQYGLVNWKMDEVLNDFALSHSLLIHLFTDKKNINTYKDFFQIKNVLSELDKHDKDLDEQLSNKLNHLVDDIISNSNLVEQANKLMQNNETNEQLDSKSFNMVFKKYLLLENRENILITPIREQTLFHVILSNAGVIATLNRDSADMLAEKLNNLVPEFDSISEAHKTKTEKLHSLRTKLKQKLEKLVDENKVLGQTLNGFCEICLNNEFRTDAFIEEHKNEIEKIDWEKLDYRSKKYF